MRYAICAVILKKISEFFGFDPVQFIVNNWIVLSFIFILFFYALYGSFKILREYLKNKKEQRR